MDFFQEKFKFYSQDKFERIYLILHIPTFKEMSSSNIILWLIVVPMIQFVILYFKEVTYFVGAAVILFCVALLASPKKKPVKPLPPIERPTRTLSTQTPIPNRHNHKMNVSSLVN